MSQNLNFKISLNFNFFFLEFLKIEISKNFLTIPNI